MKTIAVRKDVNLAKIVVWLMVISFTETLKPILIDECDNGKLKNGELTKITIQAARVPER